MQKLEERNTYTPTDIPHVSGNCDRILTREETLSVSGLKTSFNNSDAALTAIEQAGQNTSVSAVYVLNMRGQPLMPTRPGKARILLKENKAHVVRKCNRKLFKGDRSHIKNTAPRLIHGFQRFDKVLWNSIECFVFGRRKTGYFELRTLEGTKIHASAKAKDLNLLETANTFLISYMGGVRSSPDYKSGVSATPAPHGVL